MDDKIKNNKEKLLLGMADILKELNEIRIQVKKETERTIQLIIQNSILIGYIREKQLLSDYYQFSRQYSEFSKDVKN